MIRILARLSIAAGLTAVVLTSASVAQEETIATPVSYTHLRAHET